jgi:methylmalonyl-CoA/ethylmalonyl-CoA epimerase
LLQKIHHLGYAVEDLDAASRLYQERFGALLEEPETVADQGVKAVMFRVGESRIELLEPTGPDTPVGRFLAKRGEGLHHVAFQVEDIEATLGELGRDGVELIDEKPRVGAGGTRMAFVHPKSVHGVLTELVEPQD